MLAFAIFHLLAGILIGGRFRFAALLPAFAVVVIEAIIAAIYPMSWPWYLVLVIGIVALQTGYVASSFVRLRREEKREPSARASVSTPE